MNTIEYSIKINKESKLINIIGITSSALTIDYSGDVDFTRLVTALTKSIDEQNLLRPKKNNDTSGDDNALKLILETIESIIGEYNSTVQSLEGTEDEQEYSAVEDEPNNNIPSDDLPF